MDDEYWISILEKQIISIKSGAVLAVPLFA